MRKDKVMVLAGMLTRANIGKDPAPDSLVTLAKARPPSSANAAALLFCVDFMETNADERILTTDSRNWIRRLMPMTDEEFAQRHADLAEQYDRA